MKITPMKEPYQPNYPDKYSEESKKAVAERTPKRWLKIPIAVSLTAAMTLGMSGCEELLELVPNSMNGGVKTKPTAPSRTTPATPETPGYTTTDSPETTPYITYTLMGTMPVPTTQTTPIFTTAGLPTPIPWTLMGEPTPVPTPGINVIDREDIFIPLFEHGAGTGSIGCVAVTSPAFLSEEEAFAVLAAVFSDAGIDFSRDATNASGMNVPAIRTSYDTNRREVDDYSQTVSGSLSVRYLAGEIPITFVTLNNYNSWRTYENGYPQVSVQSYDIKGAAQAVADNNAFLGVFYDPAFTPQIDRDAFDRETFDREAQWAESLAKSKSMLAEQARDFINWLRAEGII